MSRAISRPAALFASALMVTNCVASLHVACQQSRPLTWTGKPRWGLIGWHDVTHMFGACYLFVANPTKISSVRGTQCFYHRPSAKEQFQHFFWNIFGEFTCQLSSQVMPALYPKCLCRFLSRLCVLGCCPFAFTHLSSTGEKVATWSQRDVPTLGVLSWGMLAADSGGRW